MDAVEEASAEVEPVAVVEVVVEEAVDAVMPRMRELATAFSSRHRSRISSITSIRDNSAAC